MTPLVLGVTLCLLTLASLRAAPEDSSPGRRLLAPAASRWLALLAYGVPAVYVLASFGWAHTDGMRYRFALRGVGFRDAPTAQQKIRLGAEASDADVVFRGLASRAGGGAVIGEISWRPPGAEGERDPAPAGQLALLPAPGNSAAVLGREHGRVFPETELARQIELADGDLLSIDDQAWRLDLRLVRFVPIEASAGAAPSQPQAIPARVYELPLVKWHVRFPFDIPQTLGQRTYRVDWLAGGGDPARVTSRFASFFYRGALPHRRLYLVDLDPEVTVKRAGSVLRPPASFSLQPGDRVRIFELPAWDGKGFAADGLRPRRSFRVVTAEPGCLAILLDTPEVHTLSLAELRRLDSGGGGRGAALRLLLTLGTSPLPVSGLHFQEVSTRVAREALATLELEPGAKTVQVASSRGVDQHAVGRPFWIGGESAASLQIDRLSPPLALAFLLLAMALAKAAAARAGQLSRLQVLFAMAIESLVAVRLVLAYRTWALPPHSEAALGLGLVAVAVVPWTFLAVSLPRRRRRDPDPGWLPSVAGCAFAAAWSWRVDSAASPLRRAVWLLCLAVVAVWAWRRCGEIPRWLRQRRDRGAAALARWRTAARGIVAPLRSRLAAGYAAVRRLPARMRFRLRQLCPEWLVSLVKWLRRLGGWLAFPVRRFLQPWRGGIWLAFTGGRLLLLALGWKESINIGSRFSLTLLHVPGAVLCEAGYLCWLWRHLRADPARRGLSRFWTFSLGVWIVPAFLVSDNGLALVNWPIFALALATVRVAVGTRRRSPGWRTTMARYGATAALSLYLLSAGTPLVGRLVLGLTTALPPERQQSLLSERNFLRLVHFADPARLEEAAVRPSEDLATMSVVMKAYTAGPQAWFGHGYLGAEVSPQLRATALRDHLPSVLIAGCWGLAGALGVIAIFGLLSGLSGLLLPWLAARDGGLEISAPGRTDLLVASGALAGLTLGLTSLYMLLTNYDLLPFTGRNVYLLGLDSTADVLESLALITLLAVGAATARERLVSPP